MKRKLSLALLIVLLCLNGCGKYSYSPVQPVENVEKIEAFYWSNYSPYKYNDLLYVDADPISVTHWDGFFPALEQLPCHKYFHDPPQGVSDWVIRITYEDESVELISASGCLYYNQDKWTERYYYFDKDAFDTLIQSIL